MRLPAGKHTDLTQDVDGDRVVRGAAAGARGQGPTGMAAQTLTGLIERAQVSADDGRVGSSAEAAVLDPAAMRGLDLRELRQEIAVAGQRLPLARRGGREVAGEDSNPVAEHPVPTSTALGLGAYRSPPAASFTLAPWPGRP